MEMIEEIKLLMIILKMYLEMLMKKINQLMKAEDGEDDEKIFNGEINDG